MRESDRETGERHRSWRNCPFSYGHMFRPTEQTIISLRVSWRARVVPSRLRRLVPVMTWMASGVHFVFQKGTSQSKLARLRRSAYASQSGCCYYCGFRMWESDPASFARVQHITVAQARSFKCTAEHLEAKEDGGKDTAQNIVAACLFCNSRRHRRKQAPSPNAYRQLVQNRLGKGRWHCMHMQR